MTGVYHSLLFALRGSESGPLSTVGDGEERWDPPASERGQATRC